jgi:hypothetical protein
MIKNIRITVTAKEEDIAVNNDITATIEWDLHTDDTEQIYLESKSKIISVKYTQTIADILAQFISGEGSNG